MQATGGPQELAFAVNLQAPEMYSFCTLFDASRREASKKVKKEYISPGELQRCIQCKLSLAVTGTVAVPTGTRHCQWCHWHCQTGVQSVPGATATGTGTLPPLTATCYSGPPARILLPSASCRRKNLPSTNFHYSEFYRILLPLGAIFYSVLAVLPPRR